MYLTTYAAKIEGANQTACWRFVFMQMQKDQIFSWCGSISFSLDFQRADIEDCDQTELMLLEAFLFIRLAQMPYCCFVEFCHNLSILLALVFIQRVTIVFGNDGSPSYIF